jgi:hypothetical protein
LVSVLKVIPPSRASSSVLEIVVALVRILLSPMLRALVILESETSRASTTPPATPVEVMRIASVKVEAVVSALFILMPA